jgi:predicted metal-dependent hydrolase
MPSTTGNPSQINDIPKRRLDFGFDAETLPRDFYRSDSDLSLFLAALSLVFPEGERFFVESVVRYRDDIDDPELLERIAGFAAQEGMHSKEHLAFNAVLESQGLSSFRDLERKVKLLLRRGYKTHSESARLAITVALEHFTAIMAEQLLTTPKMRDDLDPSVRGLWLWHALEETEHKSVAFDVYQRVDGSYLRRAAVMLTTTFFFVMFIGYSHYRLTSERRGRRTLRGAARAIRHFWIRPGYFRKLLPAYLRYFSPRFHPDRHDTTALVRKWREELFGPDGKLLAELEPRPGRQAA